MIGKHFANMCPDPAPSCNTEIKHKSAVLHMQFVSCGSGGVCMWMSSVFSSLFSNLCGNRHLGMKLFLEENTSKRPVFMFLPPFVAFFYDQGLVVASRSYISKTELCFLIKRCQKEKPSKGEVFCC